ncbi:hypothetical protein [Bacillus cereus]|uniref:hypothetical protein n=1 Tax=Bacillus cereus TaxID=1396 RepID=UPI00130420F8|nr:hypothetical protein [Bacillus cereus]
MSIVPQLERWEFAYKLVLAVRCENYVTEATSQYVSAMRLFEMYVIRLGATEQKKRSLV